MKGKVCLTMLAFAANSLLCRLALQHHHIDPVSFSNIRVISGAVFLVVFLAMVRPGVKPAFKWQQGFYLAVYVVTMAISYLHVDTGVGALLLFGTVQIAMVVYGLLKGERFGLFQGIGLVAAVGGTLALLLPGAKAPPLGSALLMVLSGLAWAAYTLSGKSMKNAVAATSGNFLIATPLTLFASLFMLNGLHADAIGILLAMLSGALASAAAYALWYSLLPKLTAVTASTVQLSVPCLATLGGILLLKEPFTLRVLLAMTAIISGVAIVIYSRSALK